MKEGGSIILEILPIAGSKRHGQRFGVLRGKRRAGRCGPSPGSWTSDSEGTAKIRVKHIGAPGPISTPIFRQDGPQAKQQVQEF